MLLLPLLPVLAAGGPAGAYQGDTVASSSGRARFSLEQLPRMLHK